ncbi:MAG: type I-MYXAN CRISPR-associated protein Cmx8 [Phormidium sp.]
MIELTYRLGQLPSPAYRAGLAGLVFLIRYLHRDRPETEPLIYTDINPYEATFYCEPEGLQALMNLAFDAHYEVKFSKSKIKDPIEIKETEEGKLYGWNLLVVKAAPLQEHDPSGLWTQLWSDWLLNSIRAIPKSRKPFQLRAKGESVAIDKLWKALEKPDAKVGLSSSALIGAEAKTSEGVSLNDTNAQQFLLNFWCYVSQPYVPCRFDSDGKREDWGYAVAIPDVQDLEDFIDGFAEFLERRRPNPPQYKGYRPLDALVELPEEAGLDSLRLIRERMTQSDLASTVEYDVLGFEVCHGVRTNAQRGPDVMTISYVQPDSERDNHYGRIRETFRCPWFRRHLLQNLLKDRPWTARWGDVLSTASQKWFDHRFFAHDCQLVFNPEKNAVEFSELVALIKSLCDRYLNARLASKNQDITWENKHKLARQEFLAVRSRSQKEAFREYFFGTLCSHVTPVIPVKKDASLSKQENAQATDEEKLRQTIALAQAIEQDTETIRGLTMLALASNFKIAETTDKKSPKEAG